jgi:hypothetical protein
MNRFVTMSRMFVSQKVLIGLLVIVMMPAVVGLGSQLLQPRSAHAATATSHSSSVAGMINQVFGPYAGSAMRIAQCESGLNPGATNLHAVGNSHAAGVFQILYPSTWDTTPYANASPYDAWSNINAAHAIFVRDSYSWREWQCQA